MAAVSVGRGANPTQSSYRGRALSRVDTEPPKEEQMELLDAMKYAKKATKTPKGKSGEGAPAPFTHSTVPR